MFSSSAFSLDQLMELAGLAKELLLGVWQFLSMSSQMTIFHSDDSDGGGEWCQW
jgi:hypothetical protein